MIGEQYLQADFRFGLIYFGSYGDRGHPQGTIRMAEPYQTIYRPILQIFTDRHGEKNRIGEMLFSLCHRNSESITLDDQYEKEFSAAFKSK